MTAFKSANEAAVEVCKILGIANTNVRKVTVGLNIDDVATVNVEFIITREQWAQIGQAQTEE